ncbi:MAG TPA: hypothetical protein VFP68_16195, partial [Burkholderiaceae bacterium]|nr:hypothetical protein [Burkholderiaceae bacterium]
MSSVPKHLMHFDGCNAISAFRAQTLLQKLKVVSPTIVGIHARYVHWAWSDAVFGPPVHDRLADLLRYGQEYQGPTADGVLIVVMPRLGTVSPWASKATDIAHNCGLPVHRI